MDPDFYPAPATLPLLLQHAVWVALAPVAWFLAAALSRARYLALAELGWPRVRGRRGRRERRERIRLGLTVPPRPSPEERALGPLRANGGNEDDGDHATSDGVPVSAAPSEVKIALGAVLCTLFLIVDILLVWNVSDGWLDAAFCTFFSALTMGFCLGEGVFWNVLGPRTTFARQSDGSIVAGRSEKEVDQTWPWTFRLACWLAAFAAFPSLGTTPKLLWVLVPFAMVPQDDHRLGESGRLWVKLPLFSALGSLTWFWLCWKIRPLPPGPESDSARAEVIYTERPIAGGSLVFWVCLPDVLVVMSTILFVQMACLLYRFDHQTSVEEADMEQQGLISSACPQPGIELPIVVVPSAQRVIRDRVRVLRANGLRHGGYFGLAVMLGVGWQVLEPAVRYLLFSNLIPLSSLLPLSRVVAAIGAAGSLAPAVFLKAWLADDLVRIRAYEEAWGK